MECHYRFFYVIRANYTQIKRSKRPIVDSSRPAALLPLTLAVALTLLLRWLLPPEAVESYFSRGWFPLFRAVWDATLARLPFPLFHLFWPLLLLFLLFEIRRYLRRRPAAGTLLAVRNLFLRLLCGLLVLLLFFFWSWGFNYGRVSVEEQLTFEVYEPELDILRERVYTTAGELSRLRAGITSDTLALTAEDLPPDLESTMRGLIAAALLRHGYPAPGRPRGWQLLPRGILLRLGTAGVYWPWAAQGNTDAGLHPLQQPAVLGHELAHAYGFGDEGTCSFWAWLAAAETDDPAVRYSLELAYWRHIAGLLRYADPEKYLAFRREVLDPGIRNDLEAIYANGEKYQDIAPALRDATYTAYLKAQGIHEGLLNYGRVVRLVEGYRRNFTPPGK